MSPHDDVFRSTRTSIDPHEVRQQPPLRSGYGIGPTRPRRTGTPTHQITPVNQGRKLRVAIIAPTGRPVPAPGYGPLELVVDGLARGLHEAGHDVCLFAASDSTCPVPKYPSLPKSSPAHVDSRSGELEYVLKAYEAMGDFDIVHDHTLIGPSYARAFPHLRVVTTNHGPWDDELTPVFRSMSRWTPIVCISESQASLSPGIPVAKVIHHGIDSSNIPVGAGDGGYFVFTGRMTPEKGPHIAARLAHKMGFKLIIASRPPNEGKELDYFNAEVKPLLGDQVEYVGEVGGADKFKLFGGAAALINPIQWDEPFGLVMIEAMACGTPVVAFRRGSVPEVVDDGVTGFVRDTEQELEKAIAKIDTIDRDACRARAENHFNYRRMADDHVAFYRQLMDPAVRRGTRVRTSATTSLPIDVAPTWPGANALKPLAQ